MIEFHLELVDFQEMTVTASAVNVDPAGALRFTNQGGGDITVLLVAPKVWRSVRQASVAPLPPPAKSAKHGTSPARSARLLGQAQMPDRLR